MASSTQHCINIQHNIRWDSFACSIHLQHSWKLHIFWPHVYLQGGRGGRWPNNTRQWMEGEGSLCQIGLKHQLEMLTAITYACLWYCELSERKKKEDFFVKIITYAGWSNEKGGGLKCDTGSLLTWSSVSLSYEHLLTPTLVGQSVGQWVSE